MLATGDHRGAGRRRVRVVGVFRAGHVRRRGVVGLRGRLCPGLREMSPQAIGARDRGRQARRPALAVPTDDESLAAVDRCGRRCAVLRAASRVVGRRTRRCRGRRRGRLARRVGTALARTGGGGATRAPAAGGRARTVASAAPSPPAPGRLAAPCAVLGGPAAVDGLGRRPPGRLDGRRRTSRGREPRNGYRAPARGVRAAGHASGRSRRCHGSHRGLPNAGRPCRDGGAGCLRRGPRHLRRAPPPDRRRPRLGAHPAGRRGDCIHLGSAAARPTRRARRRPPRRSRSNGSAGAVRSPQRSTSPRSTSVSPPRTAVSGSRTTSPMSATTSGCVGCSTRTSVDDSPPAPWSGPEGPSSRVMRTSTASPFLRWTT